MSEEVLADHATPPERHRGRQPNEVAEGLKQALVEDALRVFARRGFDGVGLRELAAETAVAHNLIRHYYGSKACGKLLWTMPLTATRRPRVVWLGLNSAPILDLHRALG